MTDYASEQEMEIEALQAILMDDIKVVEGAEGLGGDLPSYHITIAPKDEDEDEPTEIPVRMALVFSHTPQYPDELPLIKLRSIRGVRDSDLASMQSRLEEEAAESLLGMAMMFTLAQSAKDMLKVVVCGGEDGGGEDAEEAARRAAEEAELARKKAARAEGTPVNPETWAAWFDRFSAEMALEKAKQSVNNEVGKKNRLSGKAYFEQKYLNQTGDNEDEDDLDFDDAEFDDDELLDEFLEQNDRGALEAARAIVQEDP